MAIQVAGTTVISNTRGLNNIASLDATTIATIEGNISAMPDIASEAEALAGANNTKMMTPLRDRQALEALAEGAAGAPRIYGRAVIPDELATSDGVALAVNAADTYALEVGAGYYRSRGSFITQSTTFQVATDLYIRGYTGTLRFKAQHKDVSTANKGTSDLRILLNGVVVQTWNTGSGSYVVRTQDITVVPGDVVTWETRTTNSASPSDFELIGTYADNAWYRLGALTQRVYA